MEGVAVISTRRRALIGAVCLLAVLLGAPSAFAVTRVPQLAALLGTARA